MSRISSATALYDLTKEDVDRLWCRALAVLGSDPAPDDAANATAPFMFSVVYRHLDDDQRAKLREASDAYESGARGGYLTALVEACTDELRERVDALAAEPL